MNNNVIFFASTVYEPRSNNLALTGCTDKHVVVCLMRPSQVETPQDNFGHISNTETFLTFTLSLLFVLSLKIKEWHT